MGHSRTNFATVLVVGLLWAAPVHAAEPILPFHHAFDQVWRTVNRTFYDPTFGGRDWNAIGLEHRDRIAADTDRAGFVRIANEMLFELGRSHLLVVPTEELWRYAPGTFADGTTGLALRTVGSDTFVSAVRDGTSAAMTGIDVGDRVLAIGGVSIGDIAATVTPYPPFNPAHRTAIELRAVYAALYGPAGTEVTLKLADNSGDRRDIHLTRGTRTRITADDAPLAAYAFEFDARRLPDGIAYFRFNYFAPSLVPAFFAELERLGGPAGIIIDLRDNAGGYLTPVNLVATRLFRQQISFYAKRTRERLISQPLPGVGDAYAGPVTVLVDATTLSSAELFAAALQAAGRAKIVGQRTPGYALSARWRPLPRGLSLIHAVAELRLPDGTVLEGRGVNPDVAVAPDAASLAAGRDAILDAAIAYLRSNPRAE